VEKLERVVQEAAHESQHLRHQRSILSKKITLAVKKQKMGKTSRGI